MTREQLIERQVNLYYVARRQLPTTAQELADACWIEIEGERVLMVSRRVEAVPRKLKCSWTLEAARAFTFFVPGRYGPCEWQPPIRWYQIWRWLDWTREDYRDSRDFERSLIEAGVHPL